MGNGAFRRSPARKEIATPEYVPGPEDAACEESQTTFAAKSQASGRSQRHPHRISPCVSEEAGATPATGSDSPKRYQSQDDRSAVDDPATREFLAGVMKNHFVFSSLADSEYNEAFLYMHKITLDANDIVFRQGDIGDSCYFIRSGTFAVSIEGKEVKKMTAGQTFGELALLYQMKRSATITCVKKSEVWQMDHPSFRMCMDKLSSTQNLQAMDFFRTDPNFCGLPEADQELLSGLCVMQHYADSDVILREGEVGQWMLIVISGKVSSTSEASSGTGVGFDDLGAQTHKRLHIVLGSVGLVYGKRQVFGARAQGAVTCLAIGKSAFPSLTPRVENVLRRCAVQVLLLGLTPPRGPANLGIVFGNLSDNQQHRLAAVVEDAEFEKNEVVIWPGDPAQLLVVIDGEVALLSRISGFVEENDSVFCDKDMAVRANAERVLSAGMGHGEIEIFNATPMACFAVALGRVRLHRLSHTSVVAALGQPLCELARQSQIKRVLSDIFLFKNLREEQVDRTVRRMEQHSFAKGSVIVRQGDLAEHFYLIQSGSIEVRKDEHVLRTLGRWDYFGERGLLLSEKRSATCEALEDCVCLVLDAAVFFEIVGMFRKELERRIQLQDLNIKMADLAVEAVVGRGSFGVVRLVHPRAKDKIKYALKCVKKVMVIKHRQERSIVIEREVNAQCYHPCIVQFIKTFQDSKHVYFLTEFLGGGDLFFAIRDIGTLTKAQTQFFSGSITLAMEYIHARGLMYRDLKPENVLLDFEGVAKLVDFGCCTKEMRSYTLIGTPEYLAPEVILGKGYMNSVDWWSLGVMMYEFTVGPLPFGADTEDQMSTFKAICEAPLTFPSYVEDETAKTVLKGLIERDPHHRLGGSPSGAKDIKDQYFYHSFNWDALAGGFMTPPYKPNVEAMKTHWEPADGDLMDNVSTDNYGFPRGMEWAKGF